MGVVWWVCLFVCTLAYLRNHMARPNSSMHVTMAVAVCSSGGIAVCYLLPVLRMTSCFHDGPALCVPKWRENSTAAKPAASVWTIFCSTRRTSKYSLWVAPMWSKSASNSFLVNSWHAVFPPSGTQNKPLAVASQ